MSPKKRIKRSHSIRPGAARKKHKSSPSRTAIGSNRRLSDLTETLDIMIPEFAARVAAIEHLLIEKQICTRDDFIESREFVDLPRGER